MPTCTNSSKLTSRSGSGATVTSSGHLKGFVKSVNEMRKWKHGGDGKSHWEFVEKQVQVLSKISDLSLFESHPEFFLDIFWLLNSLANSDPKNSLLWNCVSLITKIVAKSPKSRSFVRDRVRPVADLSDLFLSLPTTSHERGIKVLDLMRYLTHGIEIKRLEEFLIHLLPKLVELVENKDEIVRSHSLFLLNALCHQNYVVKKYLLAILNEKKKKTFFAKECDEPKVKVLVTFLNLLLSKMNLSFEPNAITLCHIEVICDAFCASYGEEDFLLMDMFTQFLAEHFAGELGNGQQKTQTNLLSVIQQVSLVLDYSTSSNPLSNECLFRFIRISMSLSNDPLTLIDLVLKTLQPYFEFSPATVMQSHTSEAVLLLKEVVEIVEKKLTTTEFDLHNLQFQLESIVEVFVDQIVRNHKTSVEILDTLADLCRVGNWHELITKFVKPGSLSDAILSSMNSSSPMILVSYINLYSDIVAQEPDWKSAFDEVRANPDLKEIITAELKKGSLSSSEENKIIKVLQMFTCESNGESVKEEPFADEIDTNVDDKNIDLLIERMTTSLEDQTLTTEVSDILELGDYRLSMQERKTSHLKNSLRFADQRILEQNKMIQTLEMELCKMRLVMKTACESSSTAKAEMEDIRQQHGLLQDEASRFRKAMKQACTEKDSRIEELEKDLEKVTKKALKYKEQNECLQETIKEHIKTQDELQAKLKSEVKNNADKTAMLEKREDKLKKKELQLESASADRERLEADLETVKKECASLQTLTKRQEQALAKKEKQLQDQIEDLENFKKIQDTIFNLTKRP